MWLLTKDIPHHWFKKLYRQCIIMGVEAILVVLFAKFDTVVVPRVLFKAVASIAVIAEVMSVVIHLEETMVFDNPAHFFRHVRLENCGDHFAVRMWRKWVANVMQQG